MKFRGIFLVAILLVILICAAVAENPALDFTLVNKTGYTIDCLYISPADVETWGSDVLGRDVLENGEECDIVFHPSEVVNLWDIKVTWDDGSDPDIWYDVDLTTYERITFFYDRAADKTWAEGQ